MTAQLSFEHVIYYGTTTPPTIKDVIESLKGMDLLANGFLASAYSKVLGTEVLTVETLVEGFEEGSLWQKFLLVLTFGDEQKMEAAAARIRDTAVKAYQKLPGGNYPVLKGAFVSGVVGALVLTGAVIAINAVTKETQQPAPTIHLENSPIIIIGAESYQMTPQAFAEMIDAVAGRDKKKLAESAVKIIAPATRETGGSPLHIGGTEMPAMDTEIVTQTPSAFSMEQDEYTQEFNDVDLEIRATDRDKNTSGWGGVIPNIVNRRVKLILADDIDLNRLSKHANIRANVVVHFRYVPSRNKFLPSLIEVLSLVESDQE